MGNILRKEADSLTDKLAESKNRFEQFAALVPQVICELDGDFNILYVNNFGKELFGLTHTQDINLLNFIDKRNQELMMEALEKLLFHDDDFTPGIQLTFFDETNREITLLTYANIEMADQKIKTIRAIGIDLSDRITMEKQLQSLNKELSLQKKHLENFNRILEMKVKEEVEKNRIKDHLMSLQARQAAMGEMVGHIAHQWKQPLNTLNLMVVDLMDAYKCNELNAEYLNRSVEAAKNVIGHMSQTIDDFRNFFNPLNEKTPFNIKSQVETALSFIRATVEVAEIKLVNQIPNDIFAFGYPNEFSQVVINIVNNGREAIIENETKNPTINIYTSVKNNWVNINFRNNGGNIKAEYLEYIFDPYFSTKTNTDGTGIGLYLAKTIITQKMDGEIKVKNIDGGVEFVIILPIYINASNTIDANQT